MIRGIVAHSLNRVIGRNGQMPWRLRDDLRFFKQTTLGHHVIMGRKTFESIGKPLEGRTNVVVSRDASFRADGATVVASPEAALEVVGEADAFVIGGGQIYRAFMPVVQEWVITVVLAEFDGDAFFPPLPGEWREETLFECGADADNEYPFVVKRMTRV